MSDINIIFEINDTGEKVYISSEKFQRFKEVSLKFQYKVSRLKEYMIFIFNGQKVDPDKTLDQLGIKNDSKIFVISTVMEACPAFIENILENTKQKRITVRFDYKDKSVLIQCENNQKFREISLKFRNEVKCPKKNFRFIMNSQTLDPDKTLDQLGFKDFSSIYVEEIVDICGAGAFIGNILEDSTNEIDPIVIFIFKENSPGEETAICCKPNEKFKEISLRYKHLMSQKEEEEIVFLFNGHVIKPEKTLDELGIKNKSRILVMLNENQNQATPESESYKNILDEKKSSNTLNELNDSKNEEKIEKKNEPKKYNLNILYYDENLKNKENNDNCTFFEMNTYGTFYGCHYFELFKTVCKKIKNNKKEFILISSGSCAQKIFNYCSDIDEIREYFIYCFNIDKYKPLMKQYSKLKEVYCDFESLKQKLYNIKPMINDNIVSSNLIYFEDYSRKYIKLHYEFIRKYQIYKILKKHNYTESEFLELVKKKHPNYLNLAKQIFPNKNETINFFKNNIDLTKEKGGIDEEVNEMFKIDDNNLDDNIKSYINNYTKETFYYKYLNKFLREGNFDAFRILSSHLSKFIFKLYEYREKNKYYMSKKKLYRKMYLDPKDIKLYKESKGKVICYPAFTSTSLHHNFVPDKWNDRYELVLIEIEQNNTKSVVSISKDSVFQSE